MGSHRGFSRGNRRSVAIGVAAGLSFVALVLAVAWTFVPATVTYGGNEITCHPASVDRSSDPAVVDPIHLAYRPTAALRERQMIRGLSIALAVIWVPCGLILRRSARDRTLDEQVDHHDVA